MGKNLPIALRYHGGKSKIAEWVISYFPKHDIYVEPFGGGASILLNKMPAISEIYNDLNMEVVNFFRVLRSERSDELIEAIELTPYARDEFDMSYEECDCVVEKARRTAIRSMMSFGGNGMSNSKTGFRATANNKTSAPARFANYPKDLERVVNRFKQVTIENRNAIELLKIHDSKNTLFYLDPPYVMDSRKCKSRLYKHEMTDDEHRDLAAVIKQLKGKVIISGYPSELYNELYADFRRVEKISQANSLNGGVPTVEVLWLSNNIREQSLF